MHPPPWAASRAHSRPHVVDALHQDRHGVDGVERLVGVGLPRGVGLRRHLPVQQEGNASSGASCSAKPVSSWSGRIRGRQCSIGGGPAPVCQSHLPTRQIDGLQARLGHLDGLRAEHAGEARGREGLRKGAGKLGQEQEMTEHDFLSYKRDMGRWPLPMQPEALQRGCPCSREGAAPLPTWLPESAPKACT